jgi:hypothetical protein
MIAICDTIAELLVGGISEAIEVLEALGIDPDADEHSIVVTQRPKCPTCEGSGYGVLDLDRSVEPEPCSTCKGTGYVPAERTTVSDDRRIPNVTLRAALSCVLNGVRPYDQALAICQRYRWDPETPILAMPIGQSQESA